MPSVTSSPTTITSDSSAGGVAITNPGNAATSDDVYATCALTASQVTNRLNCQGYDFSAIPDGVRITGVAIGSEAKRGAGAAAYLEARIVIAGAVAGSNLSSGNEVLTAADATRTFGGPTSLAGLTITRAQVVASNFGCTVSIYETAEGSVTVSIDHVPMTVYYQTVSRSSAGISTSLSVGL